MKRLSRAQAQVIVDEAEKLGIAFVEDDFTDGPDGEDVYNPLVDRENAKMWLLDKLMSL